MPSSAKLIGVIKSPEEFQQYLQSIGMSVQQMADEGFGGDINALMQAVQSGQTGIFQDAQGNTFLDRADQGAKQEHPQQGFLAGTLDPLAPQGARPDIHSDRTGLYGYRNARDFIDTHEGPDPMYNQQPYGYSQDYREGPHTESNIRNAGYGYLLGDNNYGHGGSKKGILARIFGGR